MRRRGPVREPLAGPQRAVQRRARICGKRGTGGKRRGREPVSRVGVQKTGRRSRRLPREPRACTRSIESNDISGRPGDAAAGTRVALAPAGRDRMLTGTGCALFDRAFARRIGGGVGDAPRSRIDRASVPETIAPLPLLRRPPKESNRCGGVFTPAHGISTWASILFLFTPAEVLVVRRECPPTLASRTRAALPRAQPRDGTGRASLGPWSESLRQHPSGALASRVRSPEARRSLSPATRGGVF